jgi:hypothetical protein
MEVGEIVIVRRAQAIERSWVDRSGFVSRAYEELSSAEAGSTFPEMAGKVSAKGVR